MEVISKFVKQHERLIFGISTSLLIGYCIFRSKIISISDKKKKSNLLDVTLQKLIQESKDSRIKKIVITASPSSKGNFRRSVINFLKSRLSEQRIKVLINCSPQKLLKAGCECFLESMQPDDNEYILYYYNALKTQLLIQDTISKIQLINDNKSQQIIMICDNNPFDIKLLNASDEIWMHFLKKYQIDEKQILRSYDLIIHVIEEDSNKEEDERIKSVWAQIPQYHQIKVEEGRDRENYEIVINKIINFMEKSKESNPQLIK